MAPQIAFDSRGCASDGGVESVIADEVLEDPKDAFAAEVLDLARQDPRVCLVINDCLSSTNAKFFLDEFPDRVFDVGIAEQNMVGVAAGLASGGMIPFVCAASCFLSGRALEQIKVDIAMSKANVKLCGFSSGFTYGSLGATHHAIEDIAWIRVLPNIRFAAPCDAREARAVARAVHAQTGPAFVRLTRGGMRNITGRDEYQFGCAERLRDGTDVTLMGVGAMVHNLVQAARLLADEGITCQVLNISSIAPLDTVAIIQACRQTGRVVCAEEHQICGGLFSTVAEVVVSNAPVPMLALGVPGVFAPVGDSNDLLRHFELEPAQMALRVRHWLADVNHESKVVNCA
ncbi:MAG: transketolase family protein [Achromobacter marplatensis]|uniref:transketolase family protein n=1 Tax=Achromobacter marplatensis TaxID=470868 RepID=UPI003D008B31